LKAKTDFDGKYVVRSLTLSARITSNAAIAINPFLNMRDNPCYYTDTDSLFLKYPLDKKKYEGNQLGQLSYKVIAKRAYFIYLKTYCLVMEDDKVIIKSKGLNNKFMNKIIYILITSQVYAINFRNKKVLPIGVGWYPPFILF